MRYEHFPLVTHYISGARQAGANIRGADSNWPLVYEKYTIRAYGSCTPYRMSVIFDSCLCYTANKNMSTALDIGFDLTTGCQKRVGDDESTLV